MLQELKKGEKNMSLNKKYGSIRRVLKNPREKSRQLQQRQIENNLVFSTFLEFVLSIPFPLKIRIFRRKDLTKYHFF